jgi:hypothetical protein
MPPLTTAAMTALHHTYTKLHKLTAITAVLISKCRYRIRGHANLQEMNNMPKYGLPQDIIFF